VSSLEFVVISLPTSTERRRMVREAMEHSRWPWKFFDARSAPDSSLEFEPERSVVTRGYRLTPAELSCFSSHLDCLRNFADASNPASSYMVVLEDDVRIDGHFDFDLLPWLMNDLALDYLKLYSRFMTRFRYLGRVGYRGLYRFVVPPYGAQAYIVSRLAAQKFVDRIRRIDRPIDDELERYWRHDLPIYTLFPYPVIELSIGSTVPKGSSAAPALTWSQRLGRFSGIWREKIEREVANRRLFARDRSIAAKLARR
jgi:glycosyl transferase family 25